MSRPIPCAACQGQGYHSADICPACKGHGAVVVSKQEQCSKCKGTGREPGVVNYLPIVCTLCHGPGILTWLSAPDGLPPPIPCADIAVAVDLLHASLHDSAGPQPGFDQRLIGTALHLIALDKEQGPRVGAEPGALLARVLAQGGVLIMAHDGVYHDLLTGSPAVLVFPK